MDGRWLAWLAAAGCTLIPGSIRAEMYAPYEIESLAILSKHIVLADEVGSRTVNRATYRTFRVVKAYKGRLLPGTEIEVDDYYPREELNLGAQGKGEAKPFDPRVILFLKDRDPQDNFGRKLAPEDTPRHSIVHSGLRLLRDEQVYEFAQWNNPGPIYPRPQARRDWRQSVFPDRSRPVLLAEFEAEIARSILLVESFEAFQAIADPRLRRERIHGLLAAYDGDAEARRKAKRGNNRFWDAHDSFLGAIVEFFVKSGDVEAALEAMARVELYRFDLNSTLLLDAAIRKEFSTRARAAAIQSLDYSNFRERKVLEPLAVLAGDPVPEVRAAAREKLQELNHGYSANRHRHTPEMTEFWKNLIERIPEAREAKPGG